MELEEKIEELEGSLANLKVEIKGLLIELKELALRAQDPIRQNSPQAMVSAITPWGELVGSGYRRLAEHH